MLPGWVWAYVFIVNVLQLLGPLLLIAGIGLTVYLVAKELIKFNKKSCHEVFFVIKLEYERGPPFLKSFGPHITTHKKEG